MRLKDLPALAALAGLAAALCLARPADLAAQAGDAKPNPKWVFNGKGQKTDQVKIKGLSKSDLLYPINLNNNWGLMNQSGDIVVYPRFDWTDYGFEGYARYVVNGKTGYLRNDPATDNASEFFVKARYDYADRFADGCAVVMNKNKWGMIDRSGRTLLAMQYEGVLRMQDGFAAVQKGKRCGFINRAGDLKIPCMYKRVRSFHNGFAAVQLLNGQWGYIDKRGKMVWRDKSGKVQQLGDFHEQYARVQVNVAKGKKRWGYITKAFRVHLEPQYEDARDFHNGIAAVKVGGKWGFINASGRWAIKPMFEDADDFDDAVATGDFEGTDRTTAPNAPKPTQTAGLYALVKLNGRWGYTNRVASAGLVPQFKAAEPYFRGLARVSRDDSFAYIRENGKVVFDPRVAIALGFVDLSVAELGRLEKGAIDRAPGNRVVAAPAPRKAAKVPYPLEHQYAETLPAEDGDD